MLSAMLVSLIGMLTAAASTPPDSSVWAHIGFADREAYSEDVWGTYKVFGGTNFGISQHNLTISSQYFSGSGGWDFDKKIRVSIGQTLDDTYTRQFSTPVSWRVNLRPYSVWTSECSGNGYMWYDM